MTVDIHPTAIVQPGASLGEGVAVGPYCVVGPEVRIGDRTRLVSHVVVDALTEVGADCTLFPFAHLGGPPQHSGHRGESTRLIVGDRNVIREQATMHTGTLGGGGVTTVGHDGLFMVASHVAHDCVVGDHVTLANNAALGGHVRVGDWVFIGGLAGVHQWTRIGRYAFVGASAMVTKDVIPYGSVWGNHAHLEGLNLVGLKRRGFSRETVNGLRAAYRLLFAEEGTFVERQELVAETYAHSPEITEILGFIRESGPRPLCLPSG